MFNRDINASFHRHNDLEGKAEVELVCERLTAKMKEDSNVEFDDSILARVCDYAYECGAKLAGKKEEFVETSLRAVRLFRKCPGNATERDFLNLFKRLIKVAKYYENDFDEVDYYYGRR